MTAILVGNKTNNKYLEALTLAARPLGAASSRDLQSNSFEERCVELGFPHPRKQKSDEIVINKNLPNIFICTLDADYLTLARNLDETGKCNVLLVVGGKYNVNSHKGYFETSQAAIYHNKEIVLAHFKEPIRCHYFLSNFTEDKRMEPIDLGLVASNCIPSIHDVIQDKIIVKKILFNHGVCTAPYLECDGFLELSDTEVEQYLHAFCSKENCDEFVVKPTNADGGNGVCFFTRKKTLKAAHYIKGLLLSQLNVIVEKRIFSLPFQLDGITQDWNIRVFVTRDQNNHFVVENMMVRADKTGKPVNISISAKAMLIDDVLNRAGVKEEDQRALHQTINQECIRATMHVINDLLKDHLASKFVQQDWMGIDIIVSNENGKYIPYIIELNNEDSGGTWDYEKLLNNGNRKIQSSCPQYVDTIVRRASKQKSQEIAGNSK